jgi:dUTP pyrophosphatase
MKVKVKKLHSDAVAPKFGKPGDAGADLVATSIDVDRDLDQVVYGTGIAVEIPEGMVGLIFPRSSVRDYDLVMSNSVGVIDSGYRGEIMVTFNYKSDKDTRSVLTDMADTEKWTPFHTKKTYAYDIYNVGDRIAQLIIMPVPLVEYMIVDELSETERGTGGHGSTGQ